MISRPQRLSISVVTLFAALSATACAGREEDQATAGSSAAVTQATLDVDAVNAAIEKLRAQRASDPIGPYYEDGNRLEGCWRNPAGNKLTDLKKAFYCSMPLEFRLCNTIVLLSIDESKVADRYQGYLDCQKNVDAVFGGKGMFLYDDDVNAMYESLYLKGATLPDADRDAVVAANKPAFSDRYFTTILLAIGKSLADEAVDLAVPALTNMVDDFKSDAGEDPR